MTLPATGVQGQVATYPSRSVRSLRQSNAGPEYRTGCNIPAQR